MNQQQLPKALDDNLWLLGNYFFNLYLVQGANGSALIEMGVSATVDSVIQQLEQIGADPDYLVLTHPHSDHFTGLAGLTARYPSAVVVAAQGARDFVTHPKAGAMILAEDRFLADQLARRDLPPGRPCLDSVAFPQDYLPVDGSRTIDLGGVQLRLLQVDGHAPGNLAVHVPEKGSLFLSDSLGFHYPGRGFCPLFFTGYQGYMNTLEKLSALDVDLVCPGHQGPLRGQAAVQAFDQARRASREMQARINASAEADDVLAASLYQRYYKDEFTLYSPDNIMNCMRLLVRRARES